MARRDWRFLSSQAAVHLNLSVELFIAALLLDDVSTSMFGAGQRLAQPLENRHLFRELEELTPSEFEVLALMQGASRSVRWRCVAVPRTAPCGRRCAPSWPSWD